MPVNNMLYNGQTETRTTHITRPPFVDAIESLRQAGQMLLANRVALINDLTRTKSGRNFWSTPRPVEMRTISDLSPIFYGVINEIVYHFG